MFTTPSHGNDFSKTLSNFLVSHLKDSSFLILLNTSGCYFYFLLLTLFPFELVTLLLLCASIWVWMVNIRPSSSSGVTVSILMHGALPTVDLHTDDIKNIFPQVPLCCVALGDYD